MAERPPVTPVRRPPGPTRGQIIRRRIAALAALLIALVAVSVAVAVAVPHVHRKHTL